MILIGIPTIALLLASLTIGRLRSAESLLLMPFAAGSALLPLFSDVPFLSLRTGHAVLALFLAFEWFVLTGMGMYFDGLEQRVRRPARSVFLRHGGSALKWCAVILSLVLLVYVVGLAAQIIAAPSMTEYFLEKRAQAHAEGGIDVSNPLAYRAINFSMALILLMSSWRYFDATTRIPAWRTAFLVLLSVGSIASVLEGNRSTLIVTLIALMCFVYVRRLVPAKTMLVWIAGFVLLFVLSMQMLRLDGDFSLEGIRVAFAWFVLYAFGSLASFADFFDQGIATFWYTFDIGALKLGAELAKDIGAREFFIIDYVDVGSLSTNVYSGYAVLYDYLGAWAFAFLLGKSVVFYSVKHAGRHNFVANACYVAVLASYPLTIYHEFMLTTLYYCVNILALAGVLWLAAYLAAKPAARRGGPQTILAVGR